MVKGRSSSTERSRKIIIKRRKMIIIITRKDRNVACTIIVRGMDQRRSRVLRRRGSIEGNHLYISRKGVFLVLCFLLHCGTFLSHGRRAGSFLSNRDWGKVIRGFFFLFFVFKVDLLDSGGRRRVRGATGGVGMGGRSENKLNLRVRNVN